MAQFAVENDMTYHELKRLKNKHPKLREAYNLALDTLSCRRDIGVYNFKLNAHGIYKTQGTYCEDFQEQQKVEASLRQPDTNIILGGSLFKPVHELTDEVKPLPVRKKEEDND